jgi:hypothetical protein
LAINICCRHFVLTLMSAGLYPDIIAAAQSDSKLVIIPLQGYFLLPSICCHPGAAAAS